MRALLALYLLLSMLTCGVTTLRVFPCMGASNCGSEVSRECAFNADCSTPAAQPGQDKPASDAGKPCCFVCSPGCCCYLPPTVDFPRLVFVEEMTERPQGRQHRFAQAFCRAIWHPPSPGALTSPNFPEKPFSFIF